MVFYVFDYSKMKHSLHQCLLWKTHRKTPCSLGGTWWALTWNKTSRHFEKPDSIKGNSVERKTSQRGRLCHYLSLWHVCGLRNEKLLVFISTGIQSDIMIFLEYKLYLMGTRSCWAWLVVWNEWYWGNMDVRAITLRSRSTYLGPNLKENKTTMIRSSQVYLWQEC